MILKLATITLLVVLSHGDLAEDNDPGAIPDMETKPEYSSPYFESYSLYYASNEYYSFEDSVTIQQIYLEMQILLAKIKELSQEQSQTSNKQTYKKLQSQIDAYNEKYYEQQSQLQEIAKQQFDNCGSLGNRALEGQYIGALKHQYYDYSSELEELSDEDVQVAAYLVGKGKYSRGTIPCDVTNARYKIWSDYHRQFSQDYWSQWQNYTQYLYQAVNFVKSTNETTSKNETRYETSPPSETPVTDPAPSPAPSPASTPAAADPDQATPYGNKRLLMSMMAKPYYETSYSEWEKQVTGVDEFFSGVDRTADRITIPEENMDVNMLYVVGVELQANNGTVLTKTQINFNTQETRDIQTFENQGQFNITPKINTKFSDWRLNNSNLFPTPQEYVTFYSEDIVVSWDLSSEDFTDLEKIYIWITRGEGTEPQDWASQANKVSNTYCQISEEAKPICPWHQTDTASGNNGSTDAGTTGVPQSQPAVPEPQPATAQQPAAAEPNNNSGLRFLQEEADSDSTQGVSTDTTDTTDSTDSSSSSTSSESYSQGLAYLYENYNYFSSISQQIEIITTEKTGKQSFKSPFPFPGENFFQVGYYLLFKNGTELRAYDWIFIEGAYLGNPYAGYQPDYPYSPVKAQGYSGQSQSNSTMAPQNTEAASQAGNQASSNKGSTADSNTDSSSGQETDYGCGAGDLCNNNGKCEELSMRCECFPGHYGSKCETTLTAAQLKEEQDKNQAAIDKLLVTDISENSVVDSTVRTQILSIASSNVLTADQAELVMTLLKKTYNKISSLSEGDKYLAGIQNVFRAMDQESSNTTVTERVSETPSVDMTQADLIVNVTRKMTSMLGSTASIESKHTEFVSKVSAVNQLNSSTFSVKSVIAINGSTYNGPVYTLPVIANATGTTAILMNPIITDGLSSVSPTFTIEVTDSQGNLIEVQDSEPITITLCPTDSTIKSNEDLIPAFYDPKTKLLSNKGCQRSDTQLSKVCLTFECTHLTTFTLQQTTTAESNSSTLSTTTSMSTQNSESTQSSSYGYILALMSVMLLL